MRNTLDVLFNDRPFIKTSCRVVGSSSNKLHAAIVSTVVRLGADKSGEEAVVNVYDAVRVLSAKLVANDLHVACENDDVNLEVFHEGNLSLFLFTLGVFRNLEYFEAYPECLRNGLEVGMVRYDERDITVQFAGFVAKQYVPQHLHSTVTLERCTRRSTRAAKLTPALYVVVFGHENAEPLGARTPI